MHAESNSSHSKCQNPSNAYELKQSFCGGKSVTPRTWWKDSCSLGEVGRRGLTEERCIVEWGHCCFSPALKERERPVKVFIPSPHLPSQSSKEITTSVGADSPETRSWEIIIEPFTRGETRTLFPLILLKISSLWLLFFFLNFAVDYFQDNVKHEDRHNKKLSHLISIIKTASISKLWIQAEQTQKADEPF